MNTKKKVRSIFISDTHLGTKYAKADKLLDFLRMYQSEYLYLVGDFIDGWKMKKGIYWSQEYNYIIRRIIGMTKKENTIVKYAVGNHDEFLKPFCPSTYGEIEIDLEFIHETAKGEKILIIHGDIFDQMTKHMQWGYHLGDRLYSLVFWISELIQDFRRLLGLKGWSLSRLIKTKVKKAVNFINSFEHHVVKYTKQKKCSGVICGHIHTPIIKEVDNIQYYNCGDWVENCTALIEDYEGNIELVEY